MRTDGRRSHAGSGTRPTRRRALALIAAALAAPLVRAQAPSKTYRIALLGTTSDSPTVHKLWDGVRDEMGRLGWVEGRHYVRIDRWAHGDFNRLPDLANELVALQPDAIFVGVTEAVPYAMKATRSIPIVAVAIADPVDMGFVKSLARPGVNLTGTTAAYPEVNAKRLELLKEAMPQAGRVATLEFSRSLSSAQSLEHARAAAKALGVELSRFEVSEPKDFEEAFTRIRAARADALLVVPAAFMFVHQKPLAELALQHRLPSFWYFSTQADAGGLIAYGVELAAMWRRAAFYFDRIFRGARAEDLPFERPSKFELVVNLRTAKALGLMIPQSLLLRADRVIE
jgi:putative tryptophan/tyrosine transport system substrate-binding protein